MQAQQQQLSTTQAERVTLAQALWQLLNAGIEIGKQDIPVQQQQEQHLVPVKL